MQNWQVIKPLVILTAHAQIEERKRRIAGKKLCKQKPFSKTTFLSSCLRKQDYEKADFNLFIFLKKYGTHDRLIATQEER